MNRVCDPALDGLAIVRQCPFALEAIQIGEDHASHVAHRLLCHREKGVVETKLLETFVQMIEELVSARRIDDFLTQHFERSLEYQALTGVGGMIAAASLSS